MVFAATRARLLTSTTGLVVYVNILGKHDFIVVDKRGARRSQAADMNCFAHNG